MNKVSFDLQRKKINTAGKRAERFVKFSDIRMLYSMGLPSLHHVRCIAVIIEIALKHKEGIAFEISSHLYVCDLDF